MHINILQYFMGVSAITIGALSYLLIAGGSKEEKTKPERKVRLINLEEWEFRLQGDVDHLEECQSN